MIIALSVTGRPLPGKPCRPCPRKIGLDWNERSSASAHLARPPCAAVTGEAYAGGLGGQGRVLAWVERCLSIVFPDLGEELVLVVDKPQRFTRGTRLKSRVVRPRHRAL